LLELGAFLVKADRGPFVAREGLPFLLAVMAAILLAVYKLNVWLIVALSPLLVVSYLVFRDPHRAIPAAPLGVVSPVDGKVLRIDQVDHGVPQGGAHRIRIRVDSLGSYTARAPVEGKIMELKSLTDSTKQNYAAHALWLRTDEGMDVILQFSGYRFGFAPRALLKYGERVGQGQRCAYLRLTREAEVHVPIASLVLVEPGARLIAGQDLIAKVPQP